MDNYTAFEELFNDEIFILKSDFKNEKAEPKQKIETTPKVEQPKQEAQTEAKYDPSKIYIFSDYEISRPEKQFLAKILRAIKIDLYSIKVEEWNNEAKEYTGKNFVFSTHISDCGLTAQRISAPPLNTIEQNIELKKALWESMQKLFL